MRQLHVETTQTVELKKITLLLFAAVRKVSICTHTHRSIMETPLPVFFIFLAYLQLL